MDKPRLGLGRGEWMLVAIATVAMLLTSSIILYPQANDTSILIALRVSAMTTAIPFWLVLIASPIARINPTVGQWLQAHRFPLWLILTISHFIHLYQILLYYQFGNSCPLLVWTVTVPLWIIMFSFSILNIFNPQFLGNRHPGLSRMTVLRGMGMGYIWLVFMLAFGLSAAANHMPFYNIPGVVLYAAAAIFWVIMGWRNRKHSVQDASS